MSIWDPTYMEQTRAAFRQELGLAGLAGTAELSDAEKHQVEVEVRQLEADADGSVSHDAVTMRWAQIRDAIMESGGWSSSWAPVFAGGYRSSRELLAAATAAHARSLQRKTTLVAHGTVDLETGQARQDNPYAAASVAFAEEVAAQAQSATQQTPLAIKVGLVLGGLYLLGKWAEGRGRR